MSDADFPRLVPALIVIFFAIGLHEYAHCKVADMAGDPTPGIYGRVTLNLIKHFDPLGTIMIIFTSLYGIGIGWGKPAPMDPKKMANPRWDFFAAVLAGPLTNLVQAIVYGFAIRLLGPGEIGDRYFSHPDHSFLPTLLVLGVLINLSLCFFNLVPLGPLDGHWLVGQLLPEKQRYYYYRFNAGPGWILLIVLVVGSQLMGPESKFNLLSLMSVPIFHVFHMITGIAI